MKTEHFIYSSICLLDCSCLFLCFATRMSSSSFIHLFILISLLGRPWTKTNCTDSLPKQIMLNNDLRGTKVACGQYFTLVLTHNRDLYGIGDNKYRQLLSEEKKSIETPELLISRKMREISVGWTHCIGQLK